MFYHEGMIHMVFERKCYGDQGKAPITPYNQRWYWPPDWIECDCGDLEKITVRKGNSFYSNGHYLCKTCDREYRKIDGINRFVLVRDKVN